jgi:hypothetical protein
MRVILVYKVYSTLKYSLDYIRYQIIVQSYKIFKRMVHRYISHICI